MRTNMHAGSDKHFLKVPRHSEDLMTPVSSMSFLYYNGKHGTNYITCLNRMC